MALFTTLFKNIESGHPKHSCCAICAKSCKCENGECSSGIPPFEKPPEDANEERKSRVVSEEDRKALQDALKEYQESLCHGQASLMGDTSLHRFSDQLVDDIVDTAEYTFTFEDIIEYAPVFSSRHAHFILEILDELFGDIPEFDSKDLSAVVDDFSDLRLSTWSNSDYFDMSDSDSDDSDMLNTTELLD